MRKILSLLLVVPLIAIAAGNSVQAAEHGGKAMEKKEHAGEAAEHGGKAMEKKEHAGEAAEHAGKAAEHGGQPLKEKASEQAGSPVE